MAIEHVFMDLVWQKKVPKSQFIYFTVEQPFDMSGSLRHYLLSHLYVFSTISVVLNMCKSVLTPEIIY